MGSLLQDTSGGVELPVSTPGKGARLWEGEQLQVEYLLIVQWRQVGSRQDG